MKNFSVLIIAIFFSVGLVAQNGEEAKAILDKVSEKSKSYQTIRAKFVYQVMNQRSDVEEEYKGVIYIKGEKYKLFFMNNEIIFDGKSLTTVNLELKEAIITAPIEGDESSINPTDLFTIYDKNFRYRFMGEEKTNGRTFQLIELVPKKREGKKYSKIKVWIDKEAQQIYSLLYIGKNGVNFMLRIDEFKPDVKVIDKLFVFDSEKHPEIEIVDMR